MSEHVSNIEVEEGSPKGFGIVFSIVFAIIGLWPMFSGRPPNFLMLFLSVLILAIALIFPKILDKPNKLWIKFGIFLGAIIGPIVMALVYVAAVIPTGIFVRLVGKDLLDLKLKESKSSYWIERTEKLQSMKNQF